MPVLRVVQVVGSVDDPAAGPSYTVARLAGALARGGAEVRIRSLAGWRSDGPANMAVGEAERAGVRVLRSPLGRGPIARRIGASPHLRAALAMDASDCDVIHTHGLWLMANVYPAWAAAARDARARVVLSPRGMLGGSAFAFSRRRKRIFWDLVQRRAATAAAVFHATSPAEVEDIRAFGLRSPIAMIPNGVDPAPCGPERPAERAREILYLGRVHPKKGVEVLIRAWAAIATARPDWRLRIVGPSELGHGAELSALARRLNAPRVEFDEPAYGEARQAAYRRAALFVLPTRHDNFAMTVAEALAAGLPAIVSRGAPWPGLETERCGWWVEHGVEPLATALATATTLRPDALAAMGARGRAWMARDFAWQSAAAEMLALYHWIKHGGSPPACVAAE